ncbi:MAG: threonine synthase [Bacteroidetes bacterium HGW-Bacteroidetes-5]|jgi:threonine synthase|nr:MAG: threonine synthase [Bacteroidetes bacterium HGW-Bacteroidetes-5]
MILFSTNNKNYKVSFREAILQGLAPDGGLFMPQSLPHFSPAFINNLRGLSFSELSFRLSKEILADEIRSGEIPESDLERIVYKALNFDAPLIDMGNNTYVLELFHGPTLAFKDFGARFLAGMISHFGVEKTVVLVATSGDTGSAVANGFHNVPGVDVVILYPSGKVSKIQEQQLTTLGGNVTALEVNGTFDDCQRMVKEAFADTALRKRLNLSSANSINIARLLPQSFYYFYAAAQLATRDSQLSGGPSHLSGSASHLSGSASHLSGGPSNPAGERPLVFSVPSGNFGNLTAGLFAMQMGLPVHRFVAAVNSNDIFPKYLQTGKFEPKPSIPTLSNAMDVGNPSNFARIQALFGNADAAGKVIFSHSYSDSQTLEAIREIYTQHNYLMDPHGAVGYLALQEYLACRQSNLHQHSDLNLPADSRNINTITDLGDIANNFNSIILETAHPAKFAETVESATGVKVKIPDSLARCLKLEKISKKMNLSEFLKNFGSV